MAVQQTNVKPAGPMPFTAGEDLTGKEGLLVEVNNSAGSPVVVLNDAATEAALAMLLDGGAAASLIYAEPLQAGKTYRGIAKGAIAPGARVCLADPTTAADKGKLRTLPTAAGTYRVVGYAIENKTDGQSVLFVAHPGESVTVTE